MKMCFKSNTVLGEVIACLRKRANLSQGDMSQDGVMDLKRASYSRYETGLTPVPINALRVIAKKLGMTASELLQKSEEVERKLEGRGLREMDTHYPEDLSTWDKPEFVIELEGKGLASLVKTLI